MYKVKNGRSPAFMRELFVQDLGRPTRQGNAFVRPKVNTVYKGDSSLRNYGPIVWDEMLSDRLKDISSLNEFKNAIKTWVPKNCPCRLCKTFIQNLGFITQ